MKTNMDFERHFLQRVRVVSRSVVILNWLAMLTIFFTKGVPKPVAMVAFTVFRVTAVCATLWLLIEITEAIIKRTRVANPVIDAILTLPMFGFWFLAWASSF
jgi:hypothetical protein